MIVESELVGGECSYWACMPSKALLRASAGARAPPGACPAPREAVTGTLDVAGGAAPAATRSPRTGRTTARSTGWTARHRPGPRPGPAHRPSGSTVTAADGTSTSLTARHAVVVCTGTGALLPDIAGPAPRPTPWTSREATSASTVPGRLASSAAAWWPSRWRPRTRRSARVTLLVARRRAAGRHGAVRRRAGRRGAARAGVDVRLGHRGRAVSRADDGEVHVDARRRRRRSTADEMLVATGRTPAHRRPRPRHRRPEAGRLARPSTTPAGRRRRRGDWLYAAGDVNHRALLTHQGKYQARAAGDVDRRPREGRAGRHGPWGAHVATADHAAVPQVVFTDPEVASVGLTAAAARKAGLRDPGRSTTTSAPSPAPRLLRRRLPGRRPDGRRRGPRTCASASPSSARTSASCCTSATIAVVGEVPMDRLWHAVPAYPTHQRGLAAAAGDGRPRMRVTLPAPGRMEDRTVVITGASSGIGARRRHRARRARRRRRRGRAGTRSAPERSPRRRAGGRSSRTSSGSTTCAAWATRCSPTCPRSTCSRTTRAASETGATPSTASTSRSSGTTSPASCSRTCCCRASSRRRRMRPRRASGSCRPRAARRGPGGIRLDDLDTRRGPWLGGWRAYSAGKLENVVFTRELARRLAGTPLSAYAFHPGFVGERLRQRRGAREPRAAVGALAGAGRAAARAARRRARRPRAVRQLLRPPDGARAAAEAGGRPGSREGALVGERGAGRPALTPIQSPRGAGRTRSRPAPARAVAVALGVLPVADALALGERIAPVLGFVVAITVVAALATRAGCSTGSRTAPPASGGAAGRCSGCSWSPSPSSRPCSCRSTRPRCCSPRSS